MTSEISFSALAISIAYLIGSIPTAYITGRLVKGFDIRQVGTRNMGAMNVFYQVGFLAGLMVLAIDISKGAAVVALARLMGTPEIIQLLAGAFAVIGHGFTIFLRFRGGRGGATCIGVLAYLMPWGIPIYLAVFGVGLLFTRFPTFSYSLALVSFPFIAWLMYHDGTLVVYTILLLLLPAIKYIPRVKEMRDKAGSWRHVLLRRGLKDRL
ncbi:MAG: glycerol-3-phosphate acyltransferase [Dehalococcoidia bacterium]|nr:MAG: glycerol-3-phosphate acyltransferase [Dehalococcoidia bacterium]